MLLYYYSCFKFSDTHRRWRDAVVHGSARKGEAILAGERQQRMWAKLSELLPLHATGSPVVPCRLMTSSSRGLAVSPGVFGPP